MRNPLKIIGLGVHLVDAATQSGNAAPPGSKHRGFHEAIADYRVLMAAGPELQLDPWVQAALVRWSERWAARALSEVNLGDIQSYFAELIRLGHGDQDIRREQSLLAGFYRWARFSSWTDTDPMEAAGGQRHALEEPRVIWTETDVRRILDVCQGRSLEFLRTGALRAETSRAHALAVSRGIPRYLFPLIVLGSRTGLQLRRLLYLEWRHVDLVKARILIPGLEVFDGKEIVVKLDNVSTQVLADMCLQSKRLPQAPHRVFDGVGLPLSRGHPDESAVAQAFLHVRKRSRVAPGGFDSLRLTFAHRCALRGVPMVHPLRVGEWLDAAPVRSVYEQVDASRKPSPVTGS